MDIAASSANPDNAVLEAVENGQVAVVKRLLEENPNLIWARKPGSNETLLHLALANNHREIVGLLLQKGANPELADNAGWKPLAVAAKSGPLSLPVVELLLQYGANVDSINLRLKQSALHLCATGGLREIARILLDRGAQVDLGDVSGETPLFKAVAERRTDMVELLLQYGAAKNVRSAEGVTLESLGGNNADILRLLQSAQALRGPRVSRQDQRQAATGTQTLVALNPAPLDDQKKMVACHSFQANIIDFYIGESEERIERTVPVYSILYGQGAQAIMRDARRGVIEGKPSFRW
jgi:ankyrin repeat protein